MKAVRVLSVMWETLRLAIKIDFNSNFPIKDGLTTVNLNVGGMTCTGCERHIESRLLNFKGIKQANTSFKNTTVEVSYDPEKTDLASIKQVIRESGYQINKEK